MVVVICYPFIRVILSPVAVRSLILVLYILCKSILYERFSLFLETYVVVNRKRSLGKL